MDRIGAEAETRRKHEQVQHAAELLGQTLGEFLKPMDSGN